MVIRVAFIAVGCLGALVLLVLAVGVVVALWTEPTNPPDDGSFRDG